MFVSRLLKVFREGNPNVARLFSDPQAEEERYLEAEGYFPIMHVMAFHKQLEQREPELPRALFDIFRAGPTSGAKAVGRS
jgi:4,5-dihydroxyphthalate decarboxylase